MKIVDLDFALPDWNVPPSEPRRMSREEFLRWLEDNRRELIRRGALDKLRDDPNRCPVNAQFVLHDE